jgi:hypothetical protein
VRNTTIRLSKSTFLLPRDSKKKQRKFIEHGGTARTIASAYYKLTCILLYAVSLLGAFALTPTALLARVSVLQPSCVLGAGVPINCFDRSEFIGDISLNAQNTPFIQPNGNVMPSDRFIAGVNLEVEGRLTNAGSNNPSGTQKDHPFSLVDSVTVQGYHRIRKNQETFYVVRGPEIYQLAKIYETLAPYWVNTPSSGGSATTFTTTASATNDFRFMLPVFFPPEAMPVNKQIQYLLDAPNYDRLTLTVQWGDDQSVFTYGSRTASTFTAFGSASGSPRCRTTVLFAQSGPSLFANVVPGRVFRNFLETLTGDILNTVPNSRQFNLDRGYILRSVLVKTGVKSTAVNAGNSAYNSLSDTIYANVKVYRGQNKLIRWYVDFYTLKQVESMMNYSIQPDTGYGLIDFAKHGVPAEALDTTALTAGPIGDVDLFLQADTTGASNQGALIVQQVLRFTPSKA